MMIAYTILVGSALALEVILLFAKTNLTYHIEKEVLVIRSLGITWKRIPLNSIRKVNKEKMERMENWSNRFKLHRRRLTIHFKDRNKKPVTITPGHRYVFRSKLESAIETLEKQSATHQSQ